MPSVKNWRPRYTPLKKPLCRRIGRLIVKITPEGIYLKGLCKRKWKFIAWSLVASMVDMNGILTVSETTIGSRVLERMTASRKGKNGTAQK